MNPYYEHAGITIYHGDCRDVLVSIRADVVVTDPPYGIDYRSGMTGHDGGVALPSIVGDIDTTLRDWLVTTWRGPMLMFGTWKRCRPLGCRAVLTWDKGDHVGMGDLSLPWKPNTEEIYVLGDGFNGPRTGAVLRVNAPVTWNGVRHGRGHPHEKPEALLLALIRKCPRGIVCDPFMGTGSTLVAAKRLNRYAIGVEIEERYCEMAAKRLSQEVLPLDMVI